MPSTRAFKSGDSQAVRIPAELAYADTDIELTITRPGDVITILPASQSLADAIVALRAVPKPSIVANNPNNPNNRDATLFRLEKSAWDRRMVRSRCRGAALRGPGQASARLKRLSARRHSPRPRSSLARACPGAIARARRDRKKILDGKLTSL